MTQLSQFQCLVVKIGSSMLLESDGHIRQSWLKTVAKDIHSLHQQGKQVILVCSGSVALGRQYTISR